MAVKKTRKIRKEGDPLPSMIDSARALRALKGNMTEKQFIKAYDGAAGARGGGLKTPPKKIQTAYAKFQKSGDFEAFIEDSGLNGQQATTALGRMMKWEARS